MVSVVSKDALWYKKDQWTRGQKAVGLDLAQPLYETLRKSLHHLISFHREKVR